MLDDIEVVDEVKYAMFKSDAYINNALKIKLDEGAKVPEKKYEGDAGADIFSNENVEIKPGETVAVGTGNYFSIPEGYEVQIRSRSGLALKNNIFVLNSPGTIDHGYTGEVKVILHNLGKETFKVEKGDRIAQAVVSALVKIPIAIVESLEETERGDSGFGSTGMK